MFVFGIWGEDKGCAVEEAEFEFRGFVWVRHLVVEEVGDCEAGALAEADDAVEGAVGFDGFVDELVGFGDASRCGVFVVGPVGGIEIAGEDCWFLNSKGK